MNIPARRQHMIGDYIADFYIAKHKIVIELDGGGHYEPEQQIYDEQRNEYMCDLGLKVLRYTNREVNENFAGVCEDILRQLE